MPHRRHQAAMTVCLDAHRSALLGDTPMRDVLREQLISHTCIADVTRFTHVRYCPPNMRTTDTRGVARDLDARDGMLEVVWTTSGAGSLRWA